MDIEQFYDGDPKRRASKEYTFGSDWTDGEGARWELNWVADTGELYAMIEPREPLEEDPFGDSRVPAMPAEIVTVDILGTIDGLDAVESLLAGWSEAQATPESLAWVRDRLSSGTAGDGGGGDPAPGSLPGAG
ncbi:MAG: hypothetical protein ACK5O2_02965 [Microthrixaceae bacterium]